MAPRKRKIASKKKKKSGRYLGESIASMDLSAWDKQFKALIAMGATLEGDWFESIENNFDKKEW